MIAITLCAIETVKQCQELRNKAFAANLNSEIVKQKIRDKILVVWEYHQPLENSG